MEYEVLWGDGPLGLTLRPDLGEDMPPVVGRITRVDSAAALANVDIGHMLVSINGMDTARQGYDHVVDLLQKIPRPATLRFRVPRAVPSPSIPRVPSMRSDPRHARGSTASTSSVSSTGSGTSASAVPPRRHEQYTVVWTEGPLGMILRPDDDDVHVPCIRKITGKGAGTGMERATVGDVLVAVNGQETKALGFRSTISLLKSIRKPAVLKFKRMHRRLSRRRTSREDASVNGAPPTTSTSVSTSRPSLPTNGSGSGSALTREPMYDIVWREGDLGLKLKPGHRDVPVLSKLTGKGTASGLQNANVGDELVSVNGVLVEGQAYHDTLRMLKHSVKPAVLRFRPGRDRRTSIMSQNSITSSRSNPATMRELERVRHVHKPIYDTGRIDPPSSEDRYQSLTRTAQPLPGERVKKKKRIPLDLAQQVVAASQGIEVEQAFFAGMPITAIREGTEEAHMLRVEAKMCMQANKQRGLEQRNGAEKVNPKEALIRAEEEARVLREALEKMQSQAKVYEEALEKQKREQLLASAIRNKSGDVVAKHNLLFNELSDKIAGLRRDSYSDVDIVPMVLDEAEHQELLTDLQSVMNIPVVVPSTKYCAECGATEKESKLDLDDDGQYYCKDCWDSFLSTPGAGTVPYEQPAEEEVPVPEPPPVPRVPLVGMVADPATPPRPVLSKGDSASSSTSLTRMSSVEREQEEKIARMEAEKKLEELKQLSRTGSMRTMERQASNLNAADRTRRERRGLEELSQALLEEEERARAEGNLALAKKLSAQRARTLAEAKAEQEKQNGGSPLSSMRDLMDDNDGEYSRRYKKENGTSSSYDGPRSAIAKAASNEFNVPPPASLKRSVTLDSSLPKSSSTSVSPSTAPPAAAASRNDYDDVNSDDEADDQVDMTDAEEDVLREVEEKNFALAKQLNDAHHVIERARESIMLTGDEDAEELTSGLGLSEEQINLFKKLTSQADERMSTVDQFHPAYDSDSDSDSDESVMEGVEEGDEDEDEDDEDSGVWI